MSEQPHYRSDIDGLRAIAVLAVIGFHAFPNRVTGGFVGVDVFFVLSGFLITGILLRQLQALSDKACCAAGTNSAARNWHGFMGFIAHFYARRMVRIFPALIAVFIACYAFGWFGLFANEYQQLGKYTAAGAGFVANFVLWFEAGYFDNAADTKPLLHLWSLGVEEQFYLLWPFTLWVLWKARFHMLTAFLLLICGSYFSMYLSTHIDAVGSFFSPQTRFWELLSGAALARIDQRAHAPTAYPWFERHAWKNLSAFLGAGVIAYALFTIDKSSPWPSHSTLLLCLAVLALVYAGAGNKPAWFNRKVLSNRLLVGVGLISYPLYLWHWPLLSFARILNGATPSPSIRMTAVALSFILAYLTYVLLEKPLRYGTSWGRWLHAGQHPRGYHFKIALLCGMLALVGWAGYRAYVQEGFPWRKAVREAEGLRQQLGFHSGWGELRRDECLKHFATTSACGFTGVITKPDTILLGDSHASAAFAGLSQLTSLGNFLMIEHDSCAPLFDFDNARNGVWTNCPAVMNSSLEAALASSAHTLILAHTAAYAMRERHWQAPDSIVHQSLLKGQVAHTAEELARNFEAALHATLARLTASHKNIIYFEDVPPLNFDVASCLAARPYLPSWSHLSQTLKTPCAVSRPDIDARSAVYRRAVAKVMQDFPSVKVFKAWEAFCDAQWCWAMKDGQLLYRDDDHLSLAGSDFQAQAFAKWHQNQHR